MLVVARTVSENLFMLIAVIGGIGFVICTVRLYRYTRELRSYIRRETKLNRVEIIEPERAWDTLMDCFIPALYWWMGTGLLIVAGLLFYGLLTKEGGQVIATSIVFYLGLCFATSRLDSWSESLRQRLMWGGQ